MTLLGGLLDISASAFVLVQTCLKPSGGPTLLPLSHGKSLHELG